MEVTSHHLSVRVVRGTSEAPILSSNCFFTDALPLQDFSLLNVTTFVAAQVIYLIYGDSTWDSIGRPQDITNKLQNVDLDMKPLLGLSKQQSNQSVPTVDALDGKAVFSNSVTSPKYEITKRNLMVSTTENAPPVTLNLLQTAAKKDHHHSSLSTNAQVCSGVKG
jgi:hypothetical protein